MFYPLKLVVIIALPFHSSIPPTVGLVTYPIYYKSAEQQQLLRHNHHPIFLGPLVILWAVPVMTYDRLLLAIMLPLYIGCGSVLNDDDVIYVKGQFNVKKRQLLANGLGK